MGRTFGERTPTACCGSYGINRVTYVRSLTVLRTEAKLEGTGSLGDRTVDSPCTLALAPHGVYVGVLCIF